jgi:hypothetical protein
MKAMKPITFGKAPVSSAVKRAFAYSPPGSTFAHHAPDTEGRSQRENAHMIRPHGGKGPHNAQER